MRIEVKEQPRALSSDFSLALRSKLSEKQIASSRLSNKLQVLAAPDRPALVRTPLWKLNFRGAPKISLCPCSRSNNRLAEMIRAGPSVDALSVFCIPFRFPVFYQSGDRSDLGAI